MFSSSEWMAYCERHGLCREARQYLNEARTESPTRKVGTRARGNVAVWHSSPMMDGVVPAESWTAETAYYRECEYDTNIEEYWAQPPPVRVARTNRNGRQQRGSYTPDAVVLPIDGTPYVVEVKPLASLEARLQKGDPNWKVMGDRYCYEPARAAFADLGLAHHVVAISTAHRARTANLAILLRARQASTQYDAALWDNVQTVFENYAWLTLRQLAMHIGLDDLTAIVQLIDAGHLQADIDTELIAEPDNAVVTPCYELLDYWKGLRDCDDVQRNAASGAAVGVDTIPSHVDAMQACKNLERLRVGDNSRHGRRLRRQVENGRAQGLSPYQALLGGYHRSGNRGPHIPKPVGEYLNHFLKTEWASAKRLSQRKAYRAYCVQARNEHPQYDPVGRTTFRNAIRSLDSETASYARGGRRAAAAERAPSPVAERAIRAVLPFQIATADHYLIDLYVVIYRQGETMYVARLWLTILRDLYSGQVLGRYLSLACPSRMACAMVIRDCVRRHERLPAMIMVDRGKEFDSIYFRSLLADVGVDLAYRPAEESRFGSEAERVFGEFKTEWLPYLDGNVARWFEGRSVSTTHKPQTTAALSPTDLLEQFDQFLGWREATLHGAALATPGDAHQEMNALYPFVGIEQVMDNEFLVKSAVDVRRYSVDPRRGIHTGDDLHYWARELREVTTKREVEVRVDPECPYQLYARVGDRWVTCEASRNPRYWRKRCVDREVEALQRYGAGPLRAQAKQDAQEQLVTLQATTNVRAETCDEPREAEVDAAEDQPTGGSVFDEVRDEDPVKTLATRHGVES